jgi:phospholipid-binding lipoprotein MlaA
MILYLLLLVLSFGALANDDFLTDDTTEYEEVGQTQSYYDPLEKANRITFAITSLSTKYVLLPIAKGYKRSVPTIIQPNIRSFTTNFNALTAIPYDLLIPHKPLFVEHSSRFLTNTFFGFFGFFDIHSHYVTDKPTLGLDTVAQYYYNGNIPYLVLPWGPTNIFGIADFTSQIYFRKILPNGIWYVSFLGIVSTLSDNYDIIYDGLYNSVDPYSVTRNVYYSMQKSQIEKIRNTKYEPTQYKQLLPDDFL